MRKAQLIGSLIMTFISIVIIVMSAQMPYYSRFGFSYGFMPLWTGIFLVILSILWFFEVFRSKTEEYESKFVDDYEGFKKAAALLLSVIAVAFLLNRLGFYLTLIAFSLFVILWIERERSTKAIKDLIILGVVILGIYGLFDVFLKISFPRGILRFF